jgi:hypothetical protein
MLVVVAVVRKVVAAQLTAVSVVGVQVVVALWPQPSLTVYPEFLIQVAEVVLAVTMV